MLRSKSLAQALAVCALSLYTLASYAEGTPAACANPRKADGTMSEPYYRGVEQAMDLMSKSKNQEAIDKLQKMVEGGGSEYEKSIVYYNLGFAYSSKNDYGNAAKNFEKSLALNAMPQQQYDQLLFNLGQLYVADKQYDAGIKTLERYINESCSPVPADANIFLAQAYLENKRFKDALPQVDLAISKSKTVKESWLQLKLAINYELKNYRACADVLLKLISITPAKSDYWKQLSGMLSELKDDAGAVAVLALADRQGFLTTPNEIRNLFNVYMMVDLPYKAGNFLQDAIDKNRVPGDEKNLNSVADAWINARETAKAEVVLKKLAAQSDKGEYYFKLGAMYGDDERWKESKEMLEKANAKGSLGNKTGESWLRLGVANYGLKDFKAAETAINKAMAYDNVRNQAVQWQRQIRNDEGLSSGAPAG
jgi:tetratricopeptide (TPR) repeat protein